jgi:hypothetical protein
VRSSSSDGRRTAERHFGLVSVPVIAVPTSIGYGATSAVSSAARHAEQLRVRCLGREHDGLTRRELRR